MFVRSFRRNRKLQVNHTAPGKLRGCHCQEDLYTFPVEILYTLLWNFCTPLLWKFCTPLLWKFCTPFPWNFCTPLRWNFHAFPEGSFGFLYLFLTALLTFVVEYF